MEHISETVQRDPRFAELDREIAVEAPELARPPWDTSNFHHGYGPPAMPHEELAAHAAQMRQRNTGTFRRKAAARSGWVKRRNGAAA